MFSKLSDGHSLMLGAHQAYMDSAYKRAIAIKKRATSYDDDDFNEISFLS